MGSFRSFPSCLARALRFNAPVVIIGSANGRLRVAIRIVAAALMLTSWLALVALASAPQLHVAHHPDASHEQHQCAVTLLTQGQFESGSVPLTIVPPVAPEFVLAQIFSLPFPQSSDIRLLPGRAPPAVLFLA